jgi:hypothetical protein
MTALYSRFREHLLNWRAWEVNPIVIKETRQAVRSWAVTGMLLLFLGVLFCTALVFLVNQSFDGTVDQRLGAEIFQVFIVILTAASLFFIPLYVGVRLAAERQESNLDLLYITTLTPGRIIRGKFLCGAYMTVLFFSACMPFMAFTNLLRGVDLPTVAFILIYLFLVICVAIQVAIFFACLPVSKLFKILLGLAAAASMIPATVGLTFSFFAMLRSGIGSMMGGRAFWSVFMTVALLVLAACILLYFLSVALISPPSANRALPLRAYLTFVWIAGGIAAAFWADHSADDRRLMAWAIPTLILMGIALIVVISNHDQLSLRVRRDIPATAGWRLVAFPFFNGAAGGLLWIGFIAAVTVVVTISAPKWLTALGGFPSRWRPESMEETATMLSATVLYGFAYALTALWIHRRFLARRPPKLAGILGVLIPGLWALAPNIALFFSSRLSLHALEASQYGSAFNVFIVKEPHQRLGHVLCAGTWVVLMLVLNSAWFLRQFRAFQPLARKLTPETASSSVPPQIHTGVLNG